MLTRIISIILICSLIFIPSSVFASSVSISDTGTPYSVDDRGNITAGGSSSFSTMMSNWAYNLAKIVSNSIAINNVLQSIYLKLDSSDSWLSSIYSNMNSYTSLIYDRVNGYLPTMSSNLTNLYNRVDSMYTNIVNISGYNNAQLTQLQQINTKLDTINSVSWRNYTNIVFNGISSDNVNFTTSDYINNDVVYAKLTINSFGYSSTDNIYHLQIPVRPSNLQLLSSIEFVTDTNITQFSNFYLIAAFVNGIYTDIYFKVNNRDTLSTVVIRFNFNRSSP